LVAVTVEDEPGGRRCFQPTSCGVLCAAVEVFDLTLDGSGFTLNVSAFAALLLLVSALLFTPSVADFLEADAPSERVIFAVGSLVLLPLPPAAVRWSARSFLPATSLRLPSALPFSVLCLRNCMRVLMVSSGWHTEDSTSPAVPPALHEPCGAPRQQVLHWLLLLFCSCFVFGGCGDWFIFDIVVRVVALAFFFVSIRSHGDV